MWFYKFYVIGATYDGVFDKQSYIVAGTFWGWTLRLRDDARG